MDFISVGQEAEGFIAIGQHARGVIAFGQIATGVIAVGQVARGCFTLGQVAFGFVGWGQVGFGLLHAVGMLGAGGRGAGIVLRLTPGVGRPRVAPETIPVERAVGVGEEGWVKAELSYDSHGLALSSDGRRLPVKLDRRLQGGAGQLTVHGPRHVWAYIVVRHGVLVCERIQHSPPRPYESPGFYGMAIAQFIGLTILATAWWVLVGRDVLAILDQYVDI
jgi:hypothetical protein